MTEHETTFAQMIATLQEGRQAIRTQLQQMDEREDIGWASLEVLQQSTYELRDQADLLLAMIAERGAEEAEMIAAQELVLFFKHTSVRMMTLAEMT